jgi:hypothetical protein
VPKVHVPLGKLRLEVSRCRSVDVDGKPWPFGGRSELTWSELRIVDRPPVDVLDRVRPTHQEPLPSLDWLRSLACNPILALRDWLVRRYSARQRRIRRSLGITVSNLAHHAGDVFVMATDPTNPATWVRTRTQASADLAFGPADAGLPGRQLTFTARRPPGCA